MADLYQYRELPEEPLDCLYVLHCVEGNTVDQLNLPVKERKQLKQKAEALAPRGELGELISGECPVRIARRITFVGMGREDEVTHARVRTALRRVVQQATKNREYQIGLAIPVHVHGLNRDESRLFSLLQAALADYTFDWFKSKKNEFDKIDGLHIIPLKGESAEVLEEQLTHVRMLSSAIRMARDLGNRPGNDLTPENLANHAREMAESVGLRATILGPKELQKEKMGGILSVGGGSSQDPQLVILEHRPKKPKRSIVLVGKGVTFDSGGISLKPAKDMGWMKYDMCGAATVIGVMRAVAALELPLKVVGLFAAAENTPSGTALKPGDIITISNGKTVEVDNTDAEGRLLLADALAYSERFNPDVILDFATLTGACVVALGHEAAGIMGNDNELIAELVKLGENVGERVWHLPLYEEYRAYMDSDWADICNAGERWGGAVTAASFLSEFVPENTSWAHLDIAGVAYMEKEHNGFDKGATGFGIVLILKYLQDLLK